MQVILVIIILGFLISYWQVVLGLIAVGIIILFATKAFSSNNKRQASLHGQVSHPTRDKSNRGSMTSFSSNFQGRTTPAVLPSTFEESGINCWIAKNYSSTVAGYCIPDGMIYVGKYLALPNVYGVDCALINPDLPIRAKRDDYSERKLDYWPSYAEASPEARAAYLNWLSTGKKDPIADIGYVFLYFYGLERRLIFDPIYSPAAREEKAEITEEIVRLLGIYGHQSSFNSYAQSLLKYVQVIYGGNKLYYQEPPSDNARIGFDPILLVGLGQMIRDGVPIPANWALAWYNSVQNPPVYLKTAAMRCNDEFKRLFAEQYYKEFGDGLLLPKNKKTVTVKYTPASKSLLQLNVFSFETDLPDVSTLTSPIKKISPLIQKSQDMLENYSRYLGRNPDKVNTMEALLELPQNLWPDKVRLIFEQLRQKVTPTGALFILEATTLFSMLPEWKDKSRKRMCQFYEVLAVYGIGMEPDVRFGSPLPSEGIKFVFFSQGQNSRSEADSHYALAAMTLHLAVLVSQADGVVSEEEISLLSRKLEQWLTIQPAEKARLHAYLSWLITQKLNLSGTKKRIDLFEIEQREQIGNMLIEVAQVEKGIEIQELKLLERIFAVLGIEKASLYSKLHTAAIEPITVYSPAHAASGFAIPKASMMKNKSISVKLDMSKIASIQADTQTVTAILNNIFSQPGVDSPIASEKERNTCETLENEAVSALGLWSLPRDLSDFAYELSEKSLWSQMELEKLAEKSGLLLEGALEQINEAAFEHFDACYIDGANPYEVNQEIVAVIKQ